MPAYSYKELSDVSKMTRDEVVPYYVDLIRSAETRDVITAFNKKILSKWSLSGLSYIKEKAWKIISGRRKI